MTTKKLAPVHPGEVLLEEFLKPLDLSQNRLALNIGVPPRRVNEIVLGKRRVTAETALRLPGISTRRRSSGSAFRLTTTWMSLQTNWASDWITRSVATRWRCSVTT